MSVIERVTPKHAHARELRRCSGCARLLTDPDKEAWGVLVAAFQSEREEETRD
jgi:hypothetical protein